MPEAETVPAETEPVSFAPTPAEAESGLPDWLREAALPEAEAVPAEFEPATLEPAPVEDFSAGLPDWLQGVPLPETELPQEEPTSAEPATELPDWLLEAASLDEKLTPVASEEEAASAEAGPVTELPAWLFEAEEPAATIAGQEVQAQPPAADIFSAESSQAEFSPVLPAGELPDWLSEAEFVADETLPAAAEPAPGRRPGFSKPKNPA